MEHRINQRRRTHAAIAAITASLAVCAAAITAGPAPTTPAPDASHAITPRAASDTTRTALLVPKRVRLIINYQRTAVV